MDSPETGDPQFRGWSAARCARKRAYDESGSRPAGGLWWRWSSRYGLVDLTDEGVDGGYLKKWFAGINWSANRRIRISAGYGRAMLDKTGTYGHTNQYFTRLQWVY